MNEIIICAACNNQIDSENYDGREIASVYQPIFYWKLLQKMAPQTPEKFHEQLLSLVEQAGLIEESLVTLREEIWKNWQDFFQIKGKTIPQINSTNYYFYLCEDCGKELNNKDEFVIKSIQEQLTERGWMKFILETQEIFQQIIREIGSSKLIIEMNQETEKEINEMIIQDESNLSKRTNQSVKAEKSIAGENSKKKILSKTFLWIGLGVIVGCLIIGTIIYFFSARKKNK